MFVTFVIIVIGRITPHHGSDRIPSTQWYVGNNGQLGYHRCVRRRHGGGGGGLWCHDRRMVTATSSTVVFEDASMRLLPQQLTHGLYCGGQRSVTTHGHHDDIVLLWMITIGNSRRRPIDKDTVQCFL